MRMRARLALAACLLAGAFAATALAQAPPPPPGGFQDPIVVKAAGLSPDPGAPVGPRQGGQPTDPTTAAWQEYADGIIYYDPNYGAHWITPKATSDLWKANQATLGAPEADTDFFSKADSPAGCIGKKNLFGSITRFTGGGIVQSNLQGPVILTGPVWVAYLEDGDVLGALGPPVNRPFNPPNSAFVPKTVGFACGWITPALGSGIAPAFTMLEGNPIAKAHQAGLWSTVGYPITNQDELLFGFNVGSVQRFSRGSIYYKPAAGAQGVQSNVPDVPGRKSLLEEYEQTYGGATGVLGFPTSGILKWKITNPGTKKSDTLYTLDTEKGVLVWYPAAPGLGLPWGTTQAFTTVSVFFSSFKTTGCDNCPIFGSDQDPWFDLVLKSQPTGTITSRIPPTGNFQDAPNVVINGFTYKGSKKLVVPKVSSSTVISLTFSATDDDTTSSDDPLGTVSNSLSIANGFGVFAPIDQKNSDFEVFYSMKRDPAIAALATKNQPFRYNYQWAFKNFDTTELSEDQMADTFSDIGRDEFVLWHPFHKLFYQYVYKDLAKNGNCFGMALSSTYVQMGKSSFDAPLATAGSLSSQNGGSICTNPNQNCGPDNVTPQNGAIVRTVNEYHGYQLNAVIGNQGLDLFRDWLLSGKNLNNGLQVFASAEAGHKAGNPQLLSFAVGVGAGHTVRAYKFSRNVADPTCAKLGAGVTTCHIMYIADPNHPYTTAEAGSPDKYKLAVHPSSGKWYYSGLWNNLNVGGAAMMNTPFSWASEQMPSIVDDIPWGTLIEIGALMVFGDADVDITDQAGKKLGNASSLVTAYPAPSDRRSLEGADSVLPGSGGIVIGPGGGIFSNPCLFTTCLPTVYGVQRFAGASRQGIQIRVKPRSNYTIAFKTNDGTFVAQGGKGDGSVDQFTMLGHDLSPRGQQFVVTPGSAKTFSLQLTAPTRAFDNRALTYTATGLSIDKSVPVNAALLNAGRAFQLATNVDAAPLKYDLVISRGVDQVGLSNGVVVPDVQATGTGIFVPQRLPVLIPGAGKKRRRAAARK